MDLSPVSWAFHLPPLLPRAGSIENIGLVLVGLYHETVVKPLRHSRVAPFCIGSVPQAGPYFWNVTPHHPKTPFRGGWGLRWSIAVQTRVVRATLDKGCVLENPPGTIVEDDQSLCVILLLSPEHLAKLEILFDHQANYRRFGGATDHVLYL